MSRTRNYGKSLVVTAAAIAEADSDVMEIASSRLTRTLTDQMRLIRVLGVDVDIDSIDFTERESTDPLGGHVLGYKFRGRQKRNVFQRILWAIKL